MGSKRLFLHFLTANLHKNPISGTSSVTIFMHKYLPRYGLLEALSVYGRTGKFKIGSDVQPKKLKNVKLMIFKNQI